MRRVERLLWVLALASLGWCVWTVVESRRYQSSHRAQFPAAPSPKPAPAPAAPAPPPRTIPEGAAVGRIDIPRLGVSAVIAEGEKEATLRLAVGHIPGTAFPGEGGNVGLAGHRDSFFRPLARIRLHDEIRLTGDGGASALYRVDSIAVVEPAEVGVLAPGPRPSVTLVTCYPFRYVGAAPKRFVVRAGLVGPPAPESAAAFAQAPGPSPETPPAAGRRPRSGRARPAP